MSVFQILEIDCNNAAVQIAISVVRNILTLIQWGIPIVLIILCSFDMFKAVTSGDPKKTEEVRKTSITRLIYAIVAFLIPVIINVLFTFIGDFIMPDTSKLGGEDAKTELNESWKAFFACWNGKSTNSTQTSGLATGTCTIYNSVNDIIDVRTNISESACLSIDEGNPVWEQNR